MNLEPGQVFDRYVVEETLGRGGMALVYKVRHTQLGSHHALKVLTISSPSIRQRLVQEGQVQATLRHPNIVAVTDLLDVNGAPGLVMEFIEGPPLDRWIQQHRLTVDEALGLFRGIVAGVQAAHAKGLVHRDLKPANVLLSPSSGQFIPKVADFGLAKAVVEEGEGMGRTRSGTTMGTPQYMAPEQIRDAKNVDARADIFSLGCILYELVCGRPPFDGPDLLSIFNAVASGSFAAPVSLTPDVPRPVQDAIAGCLKVDRDRRIPDCASLLRVLDGGALSAEMPIPRPSQGGSLSASRPAASRSSETFVQEEEDGALGVAMDAGGMQGAVPAMAPRSAPSQAPAAQPSKAPRSSPPSDGSLAPRSQVSIETTGARRAGKMLALGGIGIAAVGGGALALLAILGLGGAWWWSASSAAAIEAVAARAGGDVILGDVSVGWSSVTLSDVVVNGRDGQPVAHADQIVLSASASKVLAGEVGKARFDGLTLALRRDAEGWVLPDRALAAFGAEGLHARSLTTGPVEIVVTTPEGTLTTRWADLALTDAILGGPQTWEAASFALTGLDVAAAEPALKAREITGSSSDGVIRAVGVEAWVRGRTDGVIDVPPGLAEVVPVWLGGVAPADGAWMWLDPGLLPIDPVRLDASDGTLRLLDRANAVKAVEWTIAVDRLGVGPLAADGGSLPVTFAGREGEARVSFDGDLRQDGMLRGQIGVRALPLADLGPYLAPSLEHYGVVLAGGTLDGTLDVGLKDQFLLVALDADLRDPTFTQDPNPKGDIPRRAQKLLEPRDEVAVERELSGDLGRYDFMPIHGVLKAVVDALVAPAGGSLFERRPAPAPKATTERARRREAIDEAEAAAPIAEEPAPIEEAPAPEDPPAEEPLAEAPPVEVPPVVVPEEVPPVVGDKLDRLNREVRDALDDLRLPRGGGGGR